MMLGTLLRILITAGLLAASLLGAGIAAADGAWIQAAMSIMAGNLCFVIAWPGPEAMAALQARAAELDAENND